MQTAEEFANHVTDVFCEHDNDERRRWQEEQVERVLAVHAQFFPDEGNQ
jgi:hypothetical protein